MLTKISEKRNAGQNHAVRPRCDIPKIILLLTRIEHGAISVEGLRVGRSGSIDVEVVTKTLDSYAAEDAEDITLMIVEL
jgi:cysteine sulfinate desulfinase/cysteine desulfurase-like protein